MKFNFFDYIKSLFRENKGYPIVFQSIIFVSSLSDVPAETQKDIYIVRSGDIDKWVVFKCPNNCGRRVEVNLMKTRYPMWRLTLKKKKVSLYPSVIVQGCNAHFWLNNNGILLARDDEFEYQASENIS